MRKKIFAIVFISMFLLMNLSAMGMNTTEVKESTVKTIVDEKEVIQPCKIYFLFGRLNSLNITQDENSFELDMEYISLIKIVIEMNWIVFSGWDFSFEISKSSDGFFGMSASGIDVRTRGIFVDNFICGFIIYRRLND